MSISVFAVTPEKETSSPFYALGVSLAAKHLTADVSPASETERLLVYLPVDAQVVLLFMAYVRLEVRAIAPNLKIHEHGPNFFETHRVHARGRTSSRDVPPLPLARRSIEVVSTTVGLFSAPVTPVLLVAPRIAGSQMIMDVVSRGGSVGKQLRLLIVAGENAIGTLVGVERSLNANGVGLSVTHSQDATLLSKPRPFHGHYDE